MRLHVQIDEFNELVGNQLGCNYTPIIILHELVYTVTCNSILPISLVPPPPQRA